MSYALIITLIVAIACIAMIPWFAKAWPRLRSARVLVVPGFAAFPVLAGLVWFSALGDPRPVGSTFGELYATYEEGVILAFHIQPQVAIYLYIGVQNDPVPKSVKITWSAELEAEIKKADEARRDKKGMIQRPLILRWGKRFSGADKVFDAGKGPPQPPKPDDDPPSSAPIRVN